MKKRRVWLEYLLIIAGSFIVAFGIKNMYDPASLVTGGVSGIAIIFKSKFDIPLWITNTVLNIPLFLAALKIKGWSFIRRTFVATVAMSVALLIIPEITFVPDDVFLSALFGGVIVGVGTGTVLLFSATTGGTDTMAALLQKTLFRQYSIAQIMQVLDALVVLAGATVFGIQYALYALIAIYIVAKISDGILEGVNFSKEAIIISDHYEEIADAVMNDMGRGVTAMTGKGMYSGQGKEVLFCVVSKKEIVTLRDIVQECDPRAFLIVSDAREVFGEGFIEN